MGLLVTMCRSCTTFKNDFLFNKRGEGYWWEKKSEGWIKMESIHATVEKFIQKWHSTILFSSAAFLSNSFYAE